MFHVFSSRCCFQHFSTSEQRSEAWSLESAWNSFEKKKNMKPLWNVQGFEKQTSWKVSVLDFVIHDKMSKKSDAEMNMYILMKM